MLDKFKDIILKQKEESLKLKNPLHVALTIHGVRAWCKANSKEYDDAYSKVFANLSMIAETQVKQDLRIITVYLLPEKREQSEAFPYLTKQLKQFFSKLATMPLIHGNQVKISVLGKWYDLPSEVIDPIKKTLDETKDYDRFFLNFCINYNGQEEIVDACKLVAKKVQAGKMDPETIDKQTLKENLYTSYFLPPNIIIKSGLKNSLSGFLLWDSIYSVPYYTKKPFPDLTKEDFLKAIEEYKK